MTQRGITDLKSFPIRADTFSGLGILAIRAWNVLMRPHGRVQSLEVWSTFGQ